MTVRDTTVSVVVGVLVMAAASYTFVTIATKTSAPQPQVTQMPPSPSVVASAQAVNSSEQTLKEIQAELSDLRKRLPAEPRIIPATSSPKPAAIMPPSSEGELRALREMQAELSDLKKRLPIEPSSAPAPQALRPDSDEQFPSVEGRHNSKSAEVRNIEAAPIPGGAGIARSESEPVNSRAPKVLGANPNAESLGREQEAPKVAPAVQIRPLPDQKGDRVGQVEGANGVKKYKVVINTKPSGGRIVEKGGLTYKDGDAITVTPGSHIFVISSAGYQSKSIDVSVVSSDKSIVVELTKAVVEKY